MCEAQAAKKNPCARRHAIHRGRKHALAPSTSYSCRAHYVHCHVTNATNCRISILCIHKAGPIASSKTAHETQQEQDVESENCITCHECNMNQNCLASYTGAASPRPAPPPAAAHSYGLGGCVVWLIIALPLCLSLCVFCVWAFLPPVWVGAFMQPGCPLAGLLFVQTAPLDLFNSYQNRRAPIPMRRAVSCWHC